jgi:pimeloyl-ACP methyl ester carboxylesterase
MSLALFAGIPAQAASKPVAWVTPDGVRLAGVFNPASGTGRVWILLHGLGSNKQEWLGFTRALVKQGDGFLIYDARGHGDSQQQANGQTIDYRQFQTIGPGSQWDTMVADLRSAVRFLQTKFSLDPRKIGVGGASLGANIALVYASEHPEVPAVILLSPGLQYAGIASEAPFKKYSSRPIFMAASRGDVYAHTSALQLSGLRTDPACVFVEGKGTAHGVGMLNDTFTLKLLDWIKQVR